MKDDNMSRSSTRMSISFWSCSYALMLVLVQSSIQSTSSFTLSTRSRSSPVASIPTPTSVSTTATTTRSRATVFKSSKDGNDSYEDDIDENFINSILDGGGDNNSDSAMHKCTHMIGIPLESNHDLLLELESIQRAVLYHCPLLITSCVAPVVTRMPLLLVDTNYNGDGDGDGDANTNGNANGNPISVDDLFGRRGGINAGGGSSSMSSSPGENELLTSRDPITRALHDIVNSVVDDLINVQAKAQTQTQVNGADNDSRKNNGENDEDEDNDASREGVNEDQIKPLFLKFQGLEIDGAKNEVLHAITQPQTQTQLTNNSNGNNTGDGDDDDGITLLKKVMKEIQHRVHEHSGGSWKCYLPPEDNPQGSNGSKNSNSESRSSGDSSNGGLDLDLDLDSWSPRIPFMRLPNDFFETLPTPKGYRDDDFTLNYTPEQQQLQRKWEDFTPEEKKNYVRYPEEGGNGISPIFWFKYWDDKLCNGKGVRIREMAVYGRTGPYGMTEQAFYIPHLRTPLPGGNKILQEDERKDREYDNERRLEQETLMDNGAGGSNSIDDFDDIVSDKDVDTSTFEKDMAAYKSNADRRILQTIFDSSPSDANSVGEMKESYFDMDLESILKEHDIEETFNDYSSEAKHKEKLASIDSPKVGDSVKTSDTNVPSKADEDDKKEKIIKSIAKPMATGDWSNFSKKKDKPRPQDNPILQNWKKKLDESPTTLYASGGGSKSLPPFPSDEHFAGIWKLVSTPGGNVLEDDRIFDMDPNSSENLVLRIDGTTAGGPILDIENQHRAAGGTWRFFQAQFVGPSSGEEGTDDLQLKTRLRIRLLIPPLKQKVLVMEGEVNPRAKFVSPETISQDNMNELRKSSFQPLLNNEKKEDGRKLQQDSVLLCAGEMWTEDVSTTGGERKNRVKLGKFTLSKQTDYTQKFKYSIPSPQRYQD